MSQKHRKTMIVTWGNEMQQMQKYKAESKIPGTANQQVSIPASTSNLLAVSGE